MGIPKKEAEIIDPTMHIKREWNLEVTKCLKPKTYLKPHIRGGVEQRAAAATTFYWKIGISTLYILYTPRPPPARPEHAHA